MATPAPKFPVSIHATKAICANCTYFHQWLNQADTRFTIGECRINAPVNYQGPDGKHHTRWPSVKSSDFCGRHHFNHEIPS